MASITQQQLDTFKRLHTGNPQIQALTADVVNANVAGSVVDWNKLNVGTGTGAVAGTGIGIAAIAMPMGLMSDITPCEKAIGYVIFDAVCLALGAVGLRAAVSGATIEAMTRAAAPAMSQIERIIATMAAPGAGVTDYARGIFNILKAIYSGGCLGAVFSAFTSSLSWWDGVLYGITGTATIVAALATDGVAFVAEVVILLATFGFLASDTAKAVDACSIAPAATDTALPAAVS